MLLLYNIFLIRRMALNWGGTVFPSRY